MDNESATMDRTGDASSMATVTRKESVLERAKKHFPYWIMPLICAGVWFCKFDFRYSCDEKAIMAFGPSKKKLTLGYSSYALGHDDYVARSRTARIRFHEQGPDNCLHFGYWYLARTLKVMGEVLRGSPLMPEN